MTLKTPQALKELDCVFHKVTTTDDPIIRDVSYLLNKLRPSWYTNLLLCKPTSSYIGSVKSSQA